MEGRFLSSQSEQTTVKSVQKVLIGWKKPALQKSNFVLDM